MMVEAKAKNLNRSDDEQSKNLFYKLVGKRGSKREILAPLLPGEYMDKDGQVVRDGRAAKEIQVTGSNTVPVAMVRVPLNQKPEEEMNPTMQMQRQSMADQVTSEHTESAILLQRSSPGGNLGSQVTASGRRPSLSQEQWTPAAKRKSRGSKGSPVKKSKDVDWVWDSLQM